VAGSEAEPRPFAGVVGVVIFTVVVSLVELLAVPPVALDNEPEEDCD